MDEHPEERRYWCFTCKCFTDKCSKGKGTKCKGTAIHFIPGEVIDAIKAENRAEVEQLQTSLADMVDHSEELITRLEAEGYNKRYMYRDENLQARAALKAKEERDA